MCNIFSFILITPLLGSGWLKFTNVLLPLPDTPIIAFITPPFMVQEKLFITFLLSPVLKNIFLNSIFFIINGAIFFPKISFCSLILLIKLIFPIEAK